MNEAEDFVPGRADNGYTRKQSYVYPNGDDGRPLPIYLYFAERQKNPPLPSDAYIVEGAKHWNLPNEYVEHLEQIVTAP